MTRRRHLCSMLVALLAVAPAVAAQEAANRAEGPTAAPAKPRQGRRRARPRRDPAAGAQQQAVPEPDTGPRLEAAPVPNRDIEAPRDAGTADRTRLSPSVIHRPLPNQGMAAEGSQNIQEERLFFPAPGARLNVPFSY
jgi:hypothetical protein